MSLRTAADELVVRAAALGHHGTALGPEDGRRLMAAVPSYPLWLVELLSAVPLCGLELGWQERDPEPDWDGVLWIEVAGARVVLLESLEMHPGVDLLPYGYVNFGGISGSGDPCFICVHDGIDPPLYMMFHDIDYGSEGVTVKGRRVVSPRLSEFFGAARLG